MARMKDFYKAEVAPALMKKFVAVWKSHNDIRKSDSRFFLLRIHKQATPFLEIL